MSDIEEKICIVTVGTPRGLLKIELRITTEGDVSDILDVAKSALAHSSAEVTHLEVSQALTRITERLRKAPVTPKRQTGVLLEGDRVQIHHKRSCDENYTNSERAVRAQLDGHYGTIKARNDSHGVTFQVSTSAGISWFEPEELEPLS